MEEADNGGNDWGNYEIPTETNLKEYYIKEENYDGVFGSGKVIAPINGTSGKNRFYVMALVDILYPATSYSWYAAAYEKLDKVIEYSTNDFGQGKSNTEYVMQKWNDESFPWGMHNMGSSLDMWEVIADEIDAGWFVPSKSEWSAFGEALSIVRTNYVEYKLTSWYWSSSQYDSSTAFSACFGNESISDNYVSDTISVRLSTTF